MKYKIFVSANQKKLQSERLAIKDLIVGIAELMAELCLAELL